MHLILLLIQVRCPTFISSFISYPSSHSLSWIFHSLYLHISSLRSGDIPWLVLGFLHRLKSHVLLLRGPGWPIFFHIRFPDSSRLRYQDGFYR